METTLKQLTELIRMGWSVQIVPEASAFGAVYASVVWSLKRDAVDEMLDGPIASLPMLQRVNLLSEGEGSFAECVAELHARVFPVSPFGEIGDDAAEGDFPEAEL